jgi:hypothetical protein
VSELRRVFLKEVVTANFSKSEATLWDEWQKSNRDTKLRKNQCVLFVSKTLRQLLYIVRVRAVEGTTVLDSRRWRILSGEWNPQMMQNYANDVGLHFEGFKRFEELHAEERLQKLLRRATARAKGA